MNIKFKQYVKYLTAAVILLAGVFSLPKSLQGQSLFYLGTDKTFSAEEDAYVNLEGSGRQSYQFRIYRISDPENFLLKKIQKRLVKEKNNSVFANPAALLETGWNYFKDDFRDVARNELNPRTRVYLKESAQIEFSAQKEPVNLARMELLKEHTFITSFDIPEHSQNWSYRKIPVPVKSAGFYLVEAVSSSYAAYTVVIKSNINFVVKQSDDQTVIYAAEKDTGKPVEDAAITLYNLDTGAVVSEGSTGDDGIFAVNKNTPTQSLALLKHNDQYAVSDPDFYAKSFYGKGGVRAYLYTDRPIYKPLNEVFFKGIVRNFSGSSYEPASGFGRVDVVTDKGKVVLENIPVKISADMGTFDGKFQLPDESAGLGVYHLVFKFGGDAFSTEFQVEAYRKPSFLVKVKTPKSTFIQSENIPVTIQANYYYGAPVSKARVQYRVFRKARYTYSPVGTMAYLDNAKNYLGLNPPQKSDLVLDQSGNLDSDGRLNFSIKPDSYNEDSVYTIMARVSDENESLSGSSSVSVNRGAFFIQVKSTNRVFDPEDNVKLSARLVPFDKTLNAEEKEKLVARRTVTMTLYTRGFHGISEEASRTKVKSVSVQTGAGGEAEFDFKLPGKGHFIAEFSSSDGGQSITANTTLWASAKTDTIQIPFKNLTLTAGKDIYSIGETAEILIVSPVADGYLFITQEANSILERRTIKLNGNVYKYQTKISAGMSPNFTLSVTQFAGNEVYKSEIKIVAPPQNKILKVKLDTDKPEYKPGELVTLRIATQDYRKKAAPAEVSISVVDEAIYQLQPDKNPPLLTYFYHPRRNNVQTTLSSSYRFFGYSEESRLKLALLNDASNGMAAIKDEPAERDEFKDTAFWQAKVETDDDGMAVVKFRLPANITTWRINAVAVNKNTSVGQGEIKFIAKKNLMMIAKLPPYLQKGRRQTVSANIINTTSSRITTDVVLTAENAQVTSKTTQSVTLEPNENKHVYFTILPSEKSTKDVRLSFKAAGKTGAAEYSDTLVHSLPIRPVGLYRTETVVLKLKDGSAAGDAVIQVNSEYISPSLTLHISPGYGEALKTSLTYLADYPYGCVEQTMSRFMPLLAAQKAGYISGKLKSKLPDMVNTGLRLIKGHQNSDGGFGWFEGTKSDPLMSAYVYRGLAISKQLGIDVDSYMMNRARQFLYKTLREDNHKPLHKAYIMFSLSEGGFIEKSMIEKLKDEAGSQGAYGKTLTALVLAKHNQTKEAAELFNKALTESGLNNKPDMRFSRDEDSLENDRVELTSALLLASLRLRAPDQIAENLAAILMMNRDDIAWKNSRDTGSAVLALSERMENIKESSTVSNISVYINGKMVKSFKASPRQIHEGDAYASVDPSVLRKGKNTIRIEKSAGADLFVTGALSFFDGSESFKSQNNGFRIKRTYYKVMSRSNNGRLSINASPADSFQPGDLVMVSLEVERTAHDDSYIQIDDPVLPGFSVVQKDRQYYTGSFRLEYDQRQIFDDRAVFFVQGPAQRFTIRYFLNANLPGVYKASPAKAMLMYYPGVSGHTEDDAITIQEN